MDQGDDPTSRILRALRFRPRGMTITEITKQTGIKRNSAAKYLEMMHISGKVDCQLIGTAKVFSIAQRVPLSAFLCFSRDFIVVLDSSGSITQINDRFLEDAGIKKEDVIGKTIDEARLPIVSSPEAETAIAGTRGEQTVTDIHCREKGRDADYHMQVIPTVFEDGRSGLTIVLDDVTAERQNYRNMEFLARTAMELVDMPLESNIYQYIADRVAELVPGAKVDVNALNENLKNFSIKALADRNFHDALHRILGRDPIGLELPMLEIFSGSHKDQAFKVIKKGSAEFLLEDREGPRSISLYDLCFQRIPKDQCSEIMRDQGIGKVNIFLIFWKNEFFGAVSIFLGRNDTIENIHAVESFIRQASIAISQRMTADRLRRSEEWFREMANISPHPISIIDRKGRYLFINLAFTKMFGYSLEEVRNGREWFRIAYPDPKYRKMALEAWKADLEKSQIGEFRPRRFKVRCKNGEKREVLFTPVTLSNGAQFITYVDVSGK